MLVRGKIGSFYDRIYRWLYLGFVKGGMGVREEVFLNVENFY